MADPFDIQMARVQSDPRRQWGWGPSALASPEEKDAYRVSQGEKPRDIRNDPEFREWAYNEGGYAKSRRKMRMEEDFRKYQMENFQQQKAVQQLEIEQKRFEIQERNQQLQEDDFYFKRNTLEAEQKLKAQQTSEAKEFLSAVNTLDPRSPDYRDNVIKLRRQYPLGSLDPTASAVIGEYEKAHSVYMDAEKEGAAEEKQRQKSNEAFRVQQEATASELGIDTNEFMNPETGAVDQISLMKRIGEVRREKTEESEKRSESKLLDKEKRDAAKPLIREIRDINDELEAAELTAQTSKGKVQQEALNSVKLLESRLSRREGELLTIIGTPEEEPQRPEISKEAVDAARKAIRDNPDSPQAQAARQIIEAYEASQPERPAGEEGGGETISEPETIPTPTAAAPSEQPPFLTQEQQESIPQTRREFATGEMAETLDSMEKIKAEADRLYKIRFTSKENMEKYEALQAQLSEKRKEDSKLRAARRKEIREEMKKLGPYSSGENRKKYVALERELRLISGV